MIHIDFKNKRVAVVTYTARHVDVDTGKNTIVHGARIGDEAIAHSTTVEGLRAKVLREVASRPDALNQ